MSVKVYTRPNCQPCKATKRHLTRIGVEFEEIDISTDAGALEWLTAQGFQAAPVVVSTDGAWSGYQPDRLDALKG